VKRCPTCSRSFDDDTLSFCLEDGTPLVRDSALRADSQETLVSPSPTMPTMVSGLPPTVPYPQLPGKNRFDVPVAQSRRTWPWVVAILAILFLVIAAVVIMALVVPPMLNAANNNNRPQPTPAASTPTPSPSDSAWDDMPGSEEEVKSQLTRLEEEWTEANVKGDKEALERILADEYSGGANSHTKRE